jgi:preprotein translocase subunit SecG
VLVVVSLFMVLVILMQRAKSDGGVGAALGGGMAESAFGGETANVLTKATQVGAVMFFVLAFGLYLGRLHQHRSAVASPESMLPSVEAPAFPPIDGSMPSTPLSDVPPAAPGETLETPTPGPVPPSAAPATETPPATDANPAPVTQ